MSDEHATLLIIEDDEIDVELVIRGMRKHQLPYQTLTATDGRQAMKLLRNELTDEQRNRLIILLDLNMPRMNGAEFLAELRGTPDLRRALVFVLTSSALESDLARVFEHNVAGYFLKSDFHSLLEVLKAYACSCCFPQLHPLAGPGRNVSVRPTPETVHELSVCGIAEDI